MKCLHFSAGKTNMPVSLFFLACSHLHVAYSHGVWLQARRRHRCCLFVGHILCRIFWRVCEINMQVHYSAFPKLALHVGSGYAFHFNHNNLGGRCVGDETCTAHRLYCILSTSLTLRQTLRLSNLCCYPQMCCPGIKITSAPCHVKTYLDLFSF